MGTVLNELRAPAPDMFVVSHSGARAGGPMVLLHFLRWLERSTSVDTHLVLLHGGHMEDEFKEFDARILGGAESRLWMLQHGLAKLGLSKPTSALALARLGPTMWANRHASMVLLNSVGALPALQFFPKDATGKIVLFVHEMEQSFGRTIGHRVWDRLSPRVDHFISCADVVTDVLVSKGVDPARITCHHGFIEPIQVEPLRSSYLRRTLGIPPDALVVGASGRPDWRKAPEAFVRLAATIDRLRDRRDVHFVWIGGPMEGSPRWRIMHDVEGAGLHGRVHLTDETDEPAALMGVIDVFALTSREDSYPLAIIEAAALGIPIVSFNNGGIAEFASAGGADPLAIVVPFLDVEAMGRAIIDLFEDPARRARLADDAEAFVRRTHLVDQAAPQLFDTLARIQPSLAGKTWAPAGARPS